jgi:large repetitive protein
MKGRCLGIVFCLFLTFIMFGAISFAPVSEGKTMEVEKTRITQKMLTLRMPFIENRGQTDSRVKYYAKTFAGTVFVTDEGKIVYSLPVKEKGRQITLAEKLLEARVKAVQGKEKSVTKVSYLIGNDSNKWKTDLAAYDLVSLGEVYRGIELKLYAHGNNVEKLFCVRPEADPRNIKLAIAGAKKITTDKDGDLVVGTNLGEVRFSKPVAYQEVDGHRKVVEVAYAVCGKGYGFSVGDYDRTKDLVIDPTLLYSTYLGGGSYDYGRSIAVDSSGNAYVTGNALSGDFPTAGAFQTTNAGGYDAFVTKINAAGTSLVYSTYLGGSTGDEYSNSIVVDSSGSAYVTGFTNSTDFPITTGAFQTTNAGSNDVFVTKINAAGNALVYSTYLGGTSIDQSNSIAVDSSGNAYVTGYTQSTDFPTTGAFQTTNAGTSDAFVTKINAAGTSLVYSTYLGGTYGESSCSIAVDSSGNAYVTGDTNSTGFPTTPGAYQTTIAGNYDAFVTKIGDVVATPTTPTTATAATVPASGGGGGCFIDTAASGDAGGW